MSAALWRYFLEDDVAAFRQFLANATYTSAGPPKRTSGNTSASQKITSGEIKALASSPTTPLKGSKGSLATQSALRGQDGKARGSTISLSRGEINARDSFGRTILHHAASSRISTAIEFVKALLEIPILDLYIQDAESGWTALHRALYFGNIAIAQALMLRDIQDATDYTTGVLHHAGGLVKIKDNESNSPFEVFSLTIAPRSLEAIGHSLGKIDVDDDSGNGIDLDDAGLGEVHLRNTVLARIGLDGDEVFSFGSNKNLSLGLGDEDDRQYPERVTLKRPDRLLRRFYREQASIKSDLPDSHTGALDSSSLPALIRHKQLKVQEVVMSKLHSAILTTDPQANLYICGFGAGGRLGTGDEATRFDYVGIETGGLASKRVVAIALGRDHSIAISATGEVFTWGSNRHGQLGYSLPPSATANEYPLQLLPRQLFGPMKKEAIVGAAASSIHSVIFTTTALYTFGRNEGQLGLMDADARSLEIQTTPRRVGVSILQVPIEMVSATDRATSILLESHDLIVLTHFGFTKVVFQLEGFTNYFLQGSFATRYDPAGNFICKVTSGGNTICAMSSFGEVFTIDVPKKVEITSAGVSTTNPSKARNALPQPSKVWAIRKSHMAAKDVAIGQDGSIILCTESGSVWRKEKRAIIKDLGSKATGAARRKDYKFVRIPNITHAIAVRSNAFGAFAAVRRDCDVTREQMAVDTSSLWNDLWPLLPFKDYGEVKESLDTEEPQPRFWKPTVVQNSSAHIRRAVLLSKDAEGDLKHIMAKFEPLAESTYDLWITSTVSNLRIPAHSFLIKAKSGVLRQALSKLPSLFYVSISENVLSVEYGPGDQAQIVFHEADFLTLTNLVYYMYTENVIDVWNHTSTMPRSAAGFRQVRAELMKFASILELTNLERAVRLMVEPAKCLQLDMQNAIATEDFFSDADVIIELADDHQLPAHSVLLCRRCPFFDGLFHGRAGGRWMSGRRPEGGESAEMVRVDLKHIDKPVFERVLQHIYVDIGIELFDDVVTKDLDEFLDYVIGVMSIANELMLDRLAQVCQQTLGKFGTQSQTNA
jgi:inhibitor of Bruton tyrosine kinase